MFPKNSKENDQLKKEIKFNEAIDKEMKMGFDVAFKKGTTDNTGFLELIPPTRTQQSSPWLKPSYKNWVLFAFAAVAFIVLLILILTDGPNRLNEEYNNHWPSIQSAGFHSSNQVLNSSASNIEALVQETTTTTTTTTEEPTTQKILHYIKASIIVNNATVPQMDKTLLHQYSRADPYVVLYVIEGPNHRKVGKTPVDKNTMSPRWNYLFEHEMRLSPESLLNFELYDSDNFNNDEQIGKLYVKMEDLMAQELNGQIVKRSYGKGFLWFTVHWREVYKFV